MRANIEPKEGNILTRIFSRRSTHAGSRDVLPPLTSSTNAPAVEQTAVTKKTPQELAGLTNFRVVAATGRSSGGFFEGAFGNDEEDDEEDDDDFWAKPQQPQVVLTPEQAAVVRAKESVDRNNDWKLWTWIGGSAWALLAIGFAANVSGGTGTIWTITTGAAIGLGYALAVPVVIGGIVYLIGRRYKRKFNEAVAKYKASKKKSETQPAKK